MASVFPMAFQAKVKGQHPVNTENGTAQSEKWILGSVG
jgi:hypothetical protein